MSDALPKYFVDGERSDCRLSVPGVRKLFKVGNLWEIHHQIIRRLSVGEKGCDIAKALNVSPTMVSYTKNSKIVQDKVAIMRASMDADTIDLGVRINKFAPTALEFLEDLVAGKIEDASIALRARYADKHMDRAGYAPVKKIAKVSAHLTTDEIDEIKKRSQNSARSAGVIEMEVVNG